MVQIIIDGNPGIIFFNDFDNITIFLTRSLDERMTQLTKERIRGGFRKNYRVKDDYSSRVQKRSNRILLITLAVLLVLTYIFLTEYLPRIIESFQ